MYLYAYAEDTPMSVFKELNMFRLFLTHLQFDGLTNGDWKAYALKAVSYLRLLPPDVQKTVLNMYHNSVANVYEEEGNMDKANSHRRQALSYQLQTEKEIDVMDIETLLQSMEKTPNSQLDLCLYILLLIVEPGIWATDDYYNYWTRCHYQLIETIIKQDLTKLVTDDKKMPYVALLVNSLKGIYFRRTRRFVLAEKYLLAALDIQVTLRKADKKFPLSPLMIYLQLVLNWLEGGDKERAKEYMNKANMERGCWDADLLDPVINSFHGQPISKEEWRELDASYADIYINIYKENYSLRSAIKDAIRTIFTPPEIYDDEEYEEEVENNDEYTFDDWYECAESGDTEAQLVVGHCYYTGTAVSQNYRLAREWFFLAALQGDAIAQQNLGYMYKKGYGTEINQEEAEKWYQKVKAGTSTWRVDFIEFLLK